MHEIVIPDGAKAILNGLHDAGFYAYVVGGCVRDSLLGKEPNDWDICTSATPDEVIRVLEGYEIIQTGIRHGTVTAICRGTMPSNEEYEITTFRRDGDYYDSRHPDSVEFISDLREDLSRRDFTINAMAYSEETGIVDYFGGMEDLQSGTIRCVGNAEERFLEDALRMMRALRFASTYGFKIGEKTSQAIHERREDLWGIAHERIQSELVKLLFGDGVLRVLLDYSDVISTIIPEMQPCIGFEQNNRFHQYDVYEHIAHAVANYTGRDQSVKTALLLHDIGKPLCYTEDERGGHFHGHAVHSRDISEKVLDRLKFDNKTRDEVLQLVLYHDAMIAPTTKSVKRWLNKVGETRVRQLLDVRMADVLAHKVDTQDSRIEQCNAVRQIVSEIIEHDECFSLKDLAINGADIMALGIPQGPDVGILLIWLLRKVIEGSLDNDRASLLNKAKTIVGIT